jgi:Flp pilus assembly protein TadG
MAWFRRTPVPRAEGEVDLAADTVDDSRMRRLIELSEQLRAAGVSYEEIDERARFDGVPFNAALETLHKERATRSERGAAAVEFAIVAPLLFMLVFAVIQFGLAFLQVQTIRGAVREGGRAAAVGGTVDEARDKVIEAATGTIPESLKDSIDVDTTCEKGDNQQGTDVAVSFPVGALNGGTGIKVEIPFIPTITLSPDVAAHFRCEVS